MKILFKTRRKVRMVFGRRNRAVFVMFIMIIVTAAWGHIFDV